jgi:hypothetical protein
MVIEDMLEEPACAVAGSSARRTEAGSGFDFALLDESARRAKNGAPKGN